MPEKSYVTLAQAMCPVCTKIEDTGELLLDKRLRNRFEHTTLTGWHMCAEHQKLLDDGHIALVGIDEKKSTERSPNGVWRTGDVAHVRFEVAKQMFNVPLTREDGSMLPLVWVDPQVIEMLKEKMNVE